MSDLRELYQEVILDHSKRPRNLCHPDRANRSADGHNPLCGDRITVYLVIEDDLVRDVGFEGSGCAISTASASMMTEAIKGRSVAEVDRLFHLFHDMLTSRDAPVLPPAELDKLAVFSGVREFPVRVKCATLAWHTLRAALEDVAKTVSTE
ncbi:MAG: SUF system NifU family Fe-S cluster assembly protein [Acidobacteriota bacterium]|nr:MAG: SUF system NifU family Fe-S cluster assembly protein [Acidobacteriota bacterium]